MECCWHSGRCFLDEKFHTEIPNCVEAGVERVERVERESGPLDLNIRWYNSDTERLYSLLSTHRLSRSKSLLQV